MPSRGPAVLCEITSNTFTLVPSKDKTRQPQSPFCSRGIWTTEVKLNVNHNQKKTQSPTNYTEFFWCPAFFSSLSLLLSYRRLNFHFSFQMLVFHCQCLLFKMFLLSQEVPEQISKAGPSWGIWHRFPTATRNVALLVVAPRQAAGTDAVLMLCHFCMLRSASDTTQVKALIAVSSTSALSLLWVELA